ncbi:MAG: hypothetical protein JKY00_06535 [Roseicyclus sp.]|nr:hypothetical protein [Roseicyclus sp.]
MTRLTTPRANPEMAALYLAMIEEATAVADGHRRLAAERLGPGGALRLRLLHPLVGTFTFYRFRTYPLTRHPKTRLYSCFYSLCGLRNF